MAWVLANLGDYRRIIAQMPSRGFFAYSPYMSALSLESLISRHPEQLSAEVDGEVLMMHEKSGNYFGLNPVASFIWQALSEPRTAHSLWML
jgi:hypothetical protein